MKSKLFSSIRFNYDEVTHNDEYKYQSNVTDFLYENSISINDVLMPSHNREIEKICEKIQIPREKIKAFVTPELEVNAQCLPYDDIGILYFNSSLINLLSTEEFCFVAGHEIGHYVFKHQSNEKSSEEISYMSKYREISCDRLGLIVSGNIEVSINCLVKISTGLRSEHFKLNVQSILDQENSISKNKILTHSTHPSLLSRIKALMNFNTIYVEEELSYSNKINEIKKVDEIIKKDLDKDIEKIMDKFKEKFIFWSALKIILKDKKFSDQEQEKFRNHFGEEKLNIAISFLKNNSYESVIKIINKNIEENNYVYNFDKNYMDKELKKFLE